MKKLSILTFLLFLCLPVAAQKPALDIPTKDQMTSQLKSAPCKNSERLEAVKSLFKASGASDADINVATFGDLKNVVVTKKGIGGDTVIVGAHYDKVADG